jgi:hypothetical protein
MDNFILEIHSQAGDGARTGLDVCLNCAQALTSIEFDWFILEPVKIKP